MLVDILIHIELFILNYYAASFIFSLILIFFSFSKIFQYYYEEKEGNIHSFYKGKVLPPVTAIIPVYNEENSILDTIYALLESEYENLKIIIVNDGSKDSTLGILKQSLGLYEGVIIIQQKIKTSAIKTYYHSEKFPNLVVIDKDNGGKADSLNVGLNASDTPLVVTIDSDTLLEPKSLTTLVFSILSRPNTLAVGGNLCVLNGCSYKSGKIIKKSISNAPLTAMQTVDYIRVFLYSRIGLESFGGPIILSGAFTLFERKALIDVRGFECNTVGEDMEVVVKLHEHMHRYNHPCRIGYSPAATAWTEVPSTFAALWKQRNRWHRALIDSLWRYKHMIFNYKYGMTGLVVIPYYFFIEFLGSLVEISGYLAFLLHAFIGDLNWYYFGMFILLSLGFSFVLTFLSVGINLITFNNYESVNVLFKSLFYSFLEQVTLRQYLVLCRVIATFQYLLEKLDLKKSKW